MTQPDPKLLAMMLAQRFRHGANWIQCAAQNVTRAIDSIGTRSMVPPGDVETADNLALIQQTLDGLEKLLRAKVEKYLKQAKGETHADVREDQPGADRQAVGQRGVGDDHRGQAP